MPAHKDKKDEKIHSSALDQRRFSFHIDYESMTAANEGGDLKWFDWIPVLNWINDVFFDTIVAPEQIREVVNIISLVSALLLTVAAAVPSSFDYDEHMQAFERFTNSTAYGVFPLNKDQKIHSRIEGLWQWIYSTKCKCGLPGP